MINSKVILKVIIKKENKILVLQRSLQDVINPGKWDLPGGNLEQGEDLDQALIREVKEETAVEIDLKKPLKLKSFTMNNKFIIGIVYEAEFISGEVNISHEHNDWKWIEINDVRNLDIQEWLKEMIMPYIA